MNTQSLVDQAMTLGIGEAMAEFIKVYGKDSRVYSVTFNESNGNWCVSVMSTDTGKVLARFTQNQ